MPDQVVLTDISNVSKAYAVLGGFVVIYGLVSYVAKDRLYMSEPLIAMTVGIITGPYVLGWVDPLSWADTARTNEVTYELSRLVVGVQVLFTGIALPKAYLRKEALSLTVILACVMTYAWFVSGLLIWGLIPGLTYLEALAISSAVTPTDPVLANSITKGRFAERYVPHNLRHIIEAESGANDGLGYPFLFMALYLLARTGEDRGTSIGTEVGRWVYGVVCFRVLLACVYGALVGVIAHTTLKWAETRGYIDREAFFAYGFGLAIFVLGTTGLYGSDDILACFVAGNAFTWKDWYRVRTQEEDDDLFQAILDSLLNAAIFIYIGAIIPWAAYNTGDSFLGIDPWRIVVLGITILLLRRLPAVIALYKIIPAITSFSDAIFAGWFGPIGVGALFYIHVALREIPDDGTRDRLRAVYNPVVLFCIFSSVLAHGVTVPLAKFGPHFLRRTTTFTNTRTISFTTRPSREPRDLGEASKGDVGTDGNGKTIWNPFFAFYYSIVSILLFWRKDSFWRRENEHQRRNKVLKADNISGPMKAEKQKSVPERAGEANSDDSSGENNVEKTTSQESGGSTAGEDDGAGELAVNMPQKPEPTADIKDKQSVHGSDTANGTGDTNLPPKPVGDDAAVPHETLWKYVASGDMSHDLYEALRHEMERERTEALNERASRPASRSRLVETSGTNTPSASMPGTPGGRVHFK